MNAMNMALGGAAFGREPYGHNQWYYDCTRFAYHRTATIQCVSTEQQQPVPLLSKTTAIKSINHKNSSKPRTSQHPDPRPSTPPWPQEIRPRMSRPRRSNCNKQNRSEWRIVQAASGAGVRTSFDSNHRTPTKLRSSRPQTQRTRRWRMQSRPETRHCHLRR